MSVDTRKPGIVVFLFFPSEVVLSCLHYGLQSNSNLVVLNGVTQQLNQSQQHKTHTKKKALFRRLVAFGL